MLNPDHHVDLPKHYATARISRSFSSVSNWLILIFAAVFVILFAVIGHFPLFITAIALGFSSAVVSRRIQVRRALLRYRGKVCPCCWHHSDDPKPGCRGCDHPVGRDSHRVYWRLLRLTIVGSEQWFGDQLRVENKQTPLTRVILVFIAIAITMPLLVALYIVFMTVFLKNLSWMSGVNTQGWFWMLYGPAILVSGYFARRRIGKTLHCAACEYQLAPVGPKPDMCPECGAELSRLDTISKGRQIGSWWGVAAPLAIFMLAGLLPLLNLMGSWQLSPSKFVPTQLLIDHVVIQQSIDYDVEDVLEARRLSDQDIRRMLDEIENRIRNGSNFAPREDPTHWGMNVGDLIVAEFVLRKPSHKIALKLLALEARHTDKLPYDLEVWVREAVQNDFYTQHELQSAGYY